MFLTRPLTFDPASPDVQVDWAGSEKPSLVWSIMLSNGIFIPLVTIFVTLRILTKLTMTKQVFLDDYLMVASAVFFLALASLDIAAVKWGFGKHIADLPGDTRLAQIQSVEHVLHYNLVSMVSACLSICLAKLSIIATLLHIFKASMLTTMRSVLLFTGLIVLLCCAGQFFFIMMQCSSLRLSWMVSQIGTAGTCSNLETAVLVTGSLNAITDFGITCAPIPTFMRLQMPMRQRLCLSALFLSGLIACVFGLIRVVSAKGLGDISVAIDATYSSVPYFNWSVAEAGLCIITGSIPGLRPLLATILPQFFESHSMDDFVDSVKDTVQRVASRQGSRSRSRAGSRGKSEYQHRRRSSDGGGTIKSFRGVSGENAYDELESPKGKEGPGLKTSGMPKILSVALTSMSSYTMQTVCSLKKTFNRPELSGEERGRSRLSVINELDEAASRRGNEDYKLKSLVRRVDLAGKVADVKWWWERSRLNVWRPKETPRDSMSGIIVIMTEIEPTRPRRVATPALVHRGYHV